MWQQSVINARKSEGYVQNKTTTTKNCFAAQTVNQTTSYCLGEANVGLQLSLLTYTVTFVCCVSVCSSTGCALYFMLCQRTVRPS